MENVDVINTIDTEEYVNDFTIDFDSDVLLQDFDEADVEQYEEFQRQSNIETDIEFE